jgi:protein disulfide-isomerase
MIFEEGYARRVRQGAGVSLRSCPGTFLLKRTDRLMLRRLAVFGVGALAMAVVVRGATATTPGVSWRTNLDQAKLEAAKSKRLILLHFSTRTCGPCKYLDQTVFSQPQVSDAMERDYVPVRIDADASPALAAMFRIDRVPTEVIMTAEGNVLASPPIPDKPDTYVAQLQNMARHFKQAGGVTPASGATAATVNPAYASLPVGPAAAPSGGAAEQSTPQANPQSQSNPFVSGATNRYGQAQSVYGQNSQQAASAPNATPSQAAGQAAGSAASATTTAGQNPAMPSNAMPHSYRETAAAGAGPATAESGATSSAAGTSGAQTAAAEGAALGASASAGATAAAAASQPRAPQQPAGAPPLAFDGYCPVTLKALNRWTPGNAQYGVVHRGRTYVFAGAEQRDQFMANPDSYSPVFSGLDPVLLIDKQQMVEGTRAMGFHYLDAFYLFSSKETMQKFKDHPQVYAAGVRQAMNRLDTASGGTVQR